MKGLAFGESCDATTAVSVPQKSFGRYMSASVQTRDPVSLKHLEGATLKGAPLPKLIEQVALWDP